MPNGPLISAEYVSLCVQVGRLMPVELARELADAGVKATFYVDPFHLGRSSGAREIVQMGHSLGLKERAGAISDPMDSLDSEELRLELEMVREVDPNTCSVALISPKTFDEQAVRAALEAPGSVMRQVSLQIDLVGIASPYIPGVDPVPIASCPNIHWIWDTPFPAQALGLIRGWSCFWIHEESWREVWKSIVEANPGKWVSVGDARNRIISL